MTSYVYAITVFLGVVLTVHLAMNGAVGAAMAILAWATRCSGVSAPSPRC